MHIYTLEIRHSFNETAIVLCPVILQHDTATILVDCGYAGSLPLLEAAAEQHGLSLRQLTGVIITHHDIDHMGGLFELKLACPSIRVYAYATEAAYISGHAKSLRLQQAENLYHTLPDEHKAWALSFQETLKTMQPVAVDATFTDREEPAFLPGVQIIHTPGHMPGHISLYEKSSKTLVAADALVVEDGLPAIANPSFCLDLQQAIASVKKLQQLDIERIICYHGGIIETGIQHSLQQLMAKYP